MALQLGPCQVATFISDVAAIGKFLLRFTLKCPDKRENKLGEPGVDLQIKTMAQRHHSKSHDAIM